MKVQDEPYTTKKYPKMGIIKEVISCKVIIFVNISDFVGIRLCTFWILVRRDLLYVFCVHHLFVYQSLRRKYQVHHTFLTPSINVTQGKRTIILENTITKRQQIEKLEEESKKVQLCELTLLYFLCISNLNCELTIL